VQRTNSPTAATGVVYGPMPHRGRLCPHVRVGVCRSDPSGKGRTSSGPRQPAMPGQLARGHQLDRARWHGGTGWPNALRSWSVCCGFEVTEDPSAGGRRAPLGATPHSWDCGSGAMSANGDVTGRRGCGLRVMMASGADAPGQPNSTRCLGQRRWDEAAGEPYRGTAGTTAEVSWLSARRWG